MEASATGEAVAPMTLSIIATDTRITVETRIVRERKKANISGFD